MDSNEEIQVENLDHLGLVAGMIDQIGIVQEINQLVGEQPGEIVSAGQAVKAMILNGLGLVSAPLYLFSKFFEGKATEHLIGEGIHPKDLNDDRLGRVLDQLYLTGPSQIFTAIALAAMKKFSVDVKTAHLDSSSFHVHGEYEAQRSQLKLTPKSNESKQLNGEGRKEENAARPITITHGYSRDHRPDLKQFVLDLICSGDGDVPLFLRVADGNESDQAVFAKICQEFKQQLNLETLMVADSALYSAPNLLLMQELSWLSRVPLTVKPAKQLVVQLADQDFTSSEIAGYRWSQQSSKYGGIPQRWLVVESEIRRNSDLRRLEKKLEKATIEANKQLRKLACQKFACQADAIDAATQLSQKLKFHNLTAIQTTPCSTLLPPDSVSAEVANSINYQIQATLSPDQKVIDAETCQAGRFVLATNVLASDALIPDQMLSQYKEQQSVERGFGFLKDPLFFTDSVFLKSPERIQSLALLMGLCLLVYTLAQRQLRQFLHQSQSSLKNQLGQPTSRPTLRWIFQCFQSVHLLVIHGVKQISNLTPERLEILRFFPPACRSYYLLL